MRQIKIWLHTPRCAVISLNSLAWLDKARDGIAIEPPLYSGCCRQVSKGNVSSVPHVRPFLSFQYGAIRMLS
jgi:hypothetical protein